MLELADVVRLHGPDYLKKYGSRMLPSHRRALEDILACRTPAMGGHVFECDCCGERRHAYHSCKNRSCPKCHTDDTREWIDKRRDELVGVPYFHAVFTIPPSLHDIARSNQKLFYSALLHCAAQALMKLCADPRYLGGKTGVLCVLHTWSRTLAYHPHVHCLVPAIAIGDGQGHGAPRKGFLVPVRALSVIMRAMLLERLKRELPDINIDCAARRAKWVVFIKPALQGTDWVVKYLGRYIHRIAISNSRIVGVTKQQVTFRYQDSGERKWRLLTLSGEEFLRRYLQHVLPQGFHKVRYYGLWAPGNRHLLRQLQLLFPDQQPSCADPHNGPNCDEQARQCPKCKQGTLRLVAILLRQPAVNGQRAPP